MSSFPLDPSSYKWSQQSPFLWRRRALASESMWIPRPKELHEMFIRGTISLEPPLPKPTLKSAVRNAWRKLRFEIPELVAKGQYQDGKPFMQCQIPKDEDEVNEWMNRTAFFDQGLKGISFEGQRKNLLLRKQAFDLETASLLLYLELDIDEDSVSRFHLMLNMDHEATDGIGTRILFGKYLSLLAKYLSGSPGVGQGEMEWAESSRNVLPPWISIMDEEQITSGPQYDEMAQMNKTLLLENMAQNPGLPLLTPPSPPSQQTHFITLSTTQTTALLAAIKTISPAANITSLAHASLVLALLRATPPPLPPKFFSSCWLNGRRYLHPTTQIPQPVKEYIPCCMSFAPIIFPDLASLLPAKDASKNEIKHKLKRACLVATSEYTKIRERKSILPEIVVLLETIGEAMSKAKTENQNPTTPMQRPTTAAPLLLSDGKTEQYIAHSYAHPSSSPPLFTVDEVKFAANADTELIVRMSSWRNRTTISGEWNARDYERGYVEWFLAEVVGIMLAVVD